MKLYYKFRFLLVVQRYLSKCEKKSKKYDLEKNNLQLSLDLQADHPHLWYKEARKLKRDIICHVGPTNSGKTFQALKRLSLATTGIYCGPLRLLAWEIFEKMKSEGIKCSLLTGNEKQIDHNATHLSCTVEMTSIHQEFEVAVIDEVQLIGDHTRGWAWTQAFLGLQAKEIHLCGSPSMLQVVESICAQTEDNMIVHKYERLLPLKTNKNALLSYKNIRNGDAIVAFSRKSLYGIKKSIEKNYPKNHCCVIYGSLPPKARQDQAKLFSDPTSTFNCLLATDAIGMGLNLAIRRIVFVTMEKFDGHQDRLLLPSEVKQIAGRAGRYKSIYKEGEITCLDPGDMDYLHYCLKITDPSVCKAGLYPPYEQLLLLAMVHTYNLTEDIIMDFWQYYFTDSYDTSINTTVSSSSSRNSSSSMNQPIPIRDENGRLEYVNLYLNDMISIGTIVKYFHSMEKFESSLVNYLSNHPILRHRIQRANFDFHDIKNTRMTKRSKSQSYHRKTMDSHYDYSNDREEYEEKHEEEDDDDNDGYNDDSYDDHDDDGYDDHDGYDHDGYDDDDDDDDSYIENMTNVLGYPSFHHKHKYDKLKQPLDKNKSKFTSLKELQHEYQNHNVENQTDHNHFLSMSSIQIPNMFNSNNIVYTHNMMPLSEIFKLYHDKVDLDQTSCYFLCNIDESIALASILDRYSHILSLSERYLLSKAPISKEDVELCKIFQEYMYQYCQQKLVYCPTYFDENTIPPTTAKDLLKLETTHRILDLYLWLAYRVPIAFRDIEKARDQSMRCSQLINDGLTMLSYQKKPKNNRNRIRRQYDIESMEIPLVQ